MGDLNISQAVIDFLQIYRGSEVGVETIKEINSGVLDLIIGNIVTLNYEMSEENLSQVMIRDRENKDFTLTNNSDFKFSTDTGFIEKINNRDLFNRPSTIYIENLDKFQSRFQDAVRFSQQIALIYQRIKPYELIFFSVQANLDLSHRASYPQTLSGSRGWPEDPIL